MGRKAARGVEVRAFRRWVMRAARVVLPGRGGRLVRGWVEWRVGRGEGTRAGNAGDGDEEAAGGGVALVEVWRGG